MTIESRIQALEAKIAAQSRAQVPLGDLLRDLTDEQARTLQTISAILGLEGLELAVRPSIGLGLTLADVKAMSPRERVDVYRELIRGEPTRPPYRRTRD